MSQFYCRENDLILFHTSSSSLPKLPDQSTALLYLRLLRHSFVILKSADVFFLNVLLQFYLLLFPVLYRTHILPCGASSLLFLYHIQKLSLIHI